jgi:hypothetical protein
MSRIATIVGVIVAVGFFLFITFAQGFSLFWTPGQFVNGSDANAPYDLIVQTTVNNFYQNGAGFLRGSTWTYNFTIGKSLVNGKGGTGHWIQTNETIPNKTITLVLGCDRWPIGQILDVMVTVKDGQIIYPNTQQVVQAVDPPQIVHFDYSPWSGGGC